MTHHINTDLQRLSLHDSSIVNIERSSTFIRINFDWAKLDDYGEAGISDTLILGPCTLSFYHVTGEKFYHIDDGKHSEIDDPGLDDESYMVGSNTIDCQPDKQSVKLVCFPWAPKKDIYWIEWCIDHGALSLEWNDHITQQDWLNGKMPG